MEKVLDDLMSGGFLTDHLAKPNDPWLKSFDRKKGKSRVTSQKYKNDDPNEREANFDEFNKPPGGQTYMGICWKDNLHRRVDIKWYPYDQLPFAQLYFTGSAYFNRSMRLYAKTIGFSLSDHGLQPTKVRDRSERTNEDAQARLVLKRCTVQLQLN